MLSPLQDALDGAGDLLAAYGSQLVLVAGALTAAALVMALILVAKRTQGRRDRIATWVATAMATVFAAEGMYEVATGSLHLTPLVAIGLFAVFEVAMMGQAIQARRMIKRKQDPTRQKRAIWVIAAGSGLAAASAGSSVAEWIVRAGIPVLAAYLWQQELHSGHPVNREESSWRWTPRRLLIRLGALQPGAADLQKLDHDRQVEQLVQTAYKRHKGWTRLQTYYGRRLRRLSLAASQDTLDEVLDRLGRVYGIEDETAPNTAAEPRPEYRIERGGEQPEHPEPNTGPNGPANSPNTRNRTPGRKPGSNTANTRSEQRTEQRTEPRPNTRSEQQAKPRPNTPNTGLVDELVSVLAAGHEPSVTEIQNRWGVARSTASGARNKAKARIANSAEQPVREPGVSDTPNAPGEHRVEPAPNTATEHPDQPEHPEPNTGPKWPGEHPGGHSTSGG